METQTPDPLLGLIFPGILWLMTGIAAYLLAKDKGRNVVLWTILGLVPIINFGAIMFFIGASNRRLEEKLDKLLKEKRTGQQEKDI